MARLPKGLFRRQGRSGYYFRKRVGGKIIWLSWPNRDVAARELKKIRNSGNVSSRMQVAAAVEVWLKGRIAAARGPKFQKLTRTRAEKYLIPFLGYRPLCRVTSEDLRGYRLWLDTKLAPQTVCHVLGDARGFFLWAVADGLLDRSPFPARLMPRVEGQAMGRFTRDECATLVALPEPYGFYHRLALGTGLRWGELCRADAMDLDGHRLVVVRTKSGRVRLAPLGAGLAGEIRSRIGRLVPRAEGSSGSFNRTIKALSGIPDYNVHRTRHTFAYQWLEAGGALSALQEILGHASVTTTMRYLRGLSDLAKREAERIEGVRQ